MDSSNCDMAHPGASKVLGYKCDVCGKELEKKHNAPLRFRVLSSQCEHCKEVATAAKATAKEAVKIARDAGDKAFFAIDALYEADVAFEEATHIEARKVAEKAIETVIAVAKAAHAASEAAYAAAAALQPVTVASGVTVVFNEEILQAAAFASESGEEAEIAVMRFKEAWASREITH
jgi:hypothetical protein